MKYSDTNKKSPCGDLDVYIGKRVKSRRSLLGISQEKLGSSLGITFQQIQKYEKGVNRISASSLYNIANALSI
ncbi:MAG: helix-turn-helix domain-containing protein, partial [Holosporaceae bacterium]|nr:helix-turn-helix domain-containing protein [Holosporaceae bacterium]